MISNTAALVDDVSWLVATLHALYGVVFFFDSRGYFYNRNLSLEVGQKDSARKVKTCQMAENKFSLATNASAIRRITMEFLRKVIRNM